MSAVAKTNPFARALKRVWARIPEGKWLAERELDELLLKAAGAYEGDFARAGALRAQLLSAQALEVRRVDGTRDCEYRRGGWTDWPDPGPGSDAFNAELARVSDQEQARLAALDEQRAHEFNESPLAQQRREIVRLVEETVDRRLAEVLRDMDDPLIARVRARLAADPGDTDDAA